MLAFLLAVGGETPEWDQANDDNIRPKTGRRLAELRDGMTRHVSAELAAAEAVYRALRVNGAIFLVLGLALTTSGNFV